MQRWDSKLLDPVVPGGEVDSCFAAWRWVQDQRATVEGQSGGAGHLTRIPSLVTHGTTRSIRQLDGGLNYAVNGPFNCTTCQRFLSHVHF